MHGTEEEKTMPQSFLTDPEAWDGFMGRVWHAAIGDMRADATLIELGPGSSAKIGHALALSGFSGTLHAVDKTAQALRALAEKYENLIPQARRPFAAQDFQDALGTLPQGADMLLGSHILDDFLLTCAQRQDTFGWSVKYSNAVAPETTAAWQDISRTQERLAALCEQVVADFMSAVARLAPRRIILSQYPSATLDDGGLAGLNAASIGILDTLRVRLQADYAMDAGLQDRLAALPHYFNAHIGNNVLNARYWVSASLREGS